MRSFSNTPPSPPCTYNLMGNSNAPILSIPAEIAKEILDYAALPHRQALSYVRLYGLRSLPLMSGYVNGSVELGASNTLRVSLLVTVSPTEDMLMSSAIARYPIGQVIQWSDVISVRTQLDLMEVIYGVHRRAAVFDCSSLLGFVKSDHVLESISIQMGHEDIPISNLRARICFIYSASKFHQLRVSPPRADKLMLMSRPRDDPSLVEITPMHDFDMMAAGESRTFVGDELPITMTLGPRVA